MRNLSHLRWYFAIFDFVSRVRVEKNDLDLRVIHAHLTMVISTFVLMWIYTYLAWTEFDIALPGQVGVAASLVHLLSPLLFLMTPNGFIVCGVALTAGIVHQLTFAYFSGGIESAILMWLPILPLLGGFIQGRRGLLLWTSICAVAIGSFLFLHLRGHVFPMRISYHGYQTALILLFFGWLFIIFCTTWVHVSMRDYSEKTLQEQGQKIDDLFRVLFHDLANSLGRISIGINLAERQENPDPTVRGLKVIRDAQSTMTEITQNVRHMYAASKGKADVYLSPCALNSCVEYLQRMFAADFDRKNLRFEYDFDQHKGLSVIVDQVSFNHQVLANILSNAIKFSHPGGVVKILGRLVSDQLVAIEIQDSGVGMSKEQIKTIFDLNKRTSHPGTAGESGNGFGMHIMKTFVEMYHGKVEIESSEQRSEKTSGTCVRLILKGHRAP